MRAEGQPAVGLRGGAGAPCRAVEMALEVAPGSEDEGERRIRQVGARAGGRARGDRRLRGRRVDRPRPARRRRVDVAEGVARPHLERVRAVVRSGRSRATRTPRRRRRRGGTRTSRRPRSRRRASRSGRRRPLPSAGPPESVVSGAVPSTVKPREAGVASTLPASSRARTSTRCAPSASPRSACGRAAAGPRAAVQPALEGHAAGRAERQRHVRADGRALGGAGGDRRVGRQRSTVQVRVSGAVSVGPAQTART